MEIKGKVVNILPRQSGISKQTGREWASQEFVLEIVNGQYPRFGCFRIFGSDRIEEAKLQMNEDITVQFDINAREWNGRWFNSLDAYRIERGTASAQPVVQQPTNVAPQPTAAAAPQSTAAPDPFAPTNNDELPF